MKGYIIKINVADSVSDFSHGLVREVNALYIPEKGLYYYEGMVYRDETKKEEEPLFDLKNAKEVEVDNELVEKMNKFVDLKNELREKLDKIIGIKRKLVR